MFIHDESANPTGSFKARGLAVAAGLCVPTVFADRLVLRVLKDSGGTELAVRDQARLAAQGEMAQAHGPVCGACENRTGSEPTQRVVLFNTASGLKYL